MMDFFGAQEHARKQSRRLIWVFGLAVLAIVVVIDLLVLGALEMGADPTRLVQGGLVERNAGALIATSLFTLGIIGCASLFKIAKLRSGGEAVARELGATLVPMDTSDPLLRRLRNVVEEIAIASGVPVPQVFVLEDEGGINAFAAGYAPGDAAVAVTRGALERLNRDELQGVIAHEFSHVLNGDMRLNIRLMGVLFGILVLAIVGREVLLRVRGGGDRNAAAILVAALALIVVGYVGLLAGRMIKAGVSRQREYLADASAVQFTRQPDGIAGALKKIAASAGGSKLTQHNGEEISHMLFGDGVGYSALFATHPPLHDRIKRVQPGFDPRELASLGKALDSGSIAGSNLAAARAELAMGLAGGGGMPPAVPAPPLPLPTKSQSLEPARVSGQVANPARDDYILAGTITDGMPAGLLQVARGSQTAPWLVLALSTGSDEELVARQLGLIQKRLGGGSSQLVAGIRAQIDGIHPMHVLPLAQIAFPSLRRQTRAFLATFIDTLDDIIRADGHVDLREYCLARLVRVNLVDAMDPSRGQVLGSLKLAECRAEVVALFSLLADAGHEGREAAGRAFASGVSGLFGQTPVAFATPSDWRAALDAAWPILDRLNGDSKQLLIEGLVRVMMHDGRVTVTESELLRTVCAALHCPLPPMLIR
jgi:Zn-dependent protease with chaperone function